MSRNKFLPRVDVLPEDDRNRQLAVGFSLHPAVNVNCFKILPEAGGWARVRDEFVETQIAVLRQFPDRVLILLFDFDTDASRRLHFEQRIPPDLKPRVFLIGSWENPEQLKIGGKYESFGKELADACVVNQTGGWGHPLLVHNAQEVERMRTVVRPILFKL